MKYLLLFFAAILFITPLISSAALRYSHTSKEKGTRAEKRDRDLRWKKNPKSPNEKDGPKKVKYRKEHRKELP